MVCNGAQNGSITFTNSQGGSGNYEYSIDGGQTWVAQNIFSNLSGGIYDLRIREFNNPSCAYIVNTNVVVNEPAQLNAVVIPNSFILYTIPISATA